MLGSSGNSLFLRVLTRPVLYKVKADHVWLTLYELCQTVQFLAQLKQLSKLKLSIFLIIFQKVHQSSDDSDGTVTLDPTPDMDTGVPELRRTDSVIVSLFEYLNIFT